MKKTEQNETIQNECGKKEKVRAGRCRAAAIVCGFVLLAVAVSTVLPIHGEEKIYDSVVRLHVLANSDSEEDQRLKLAVRDAVIEQARGLMEGCATQEQARLALIGAGEDLCQTAKRVIEREGYDYPVTICLGYEDYPTREYETCAFPAGKYLSLRILIGEGAGKNWWCCLFPSLCLSVAEGKSRADNENSFVSVGLTKEQYGVITETDKVKYKARFKIMESIGFLFG